MKFILLYTYMKRGYLYYFMLNIERLRTETDVYNFRRTAAALNRIIDT